MPTTSLPPIRVKVDWNDNGFLNPAMASTELENLLPTPISLVDVKKVGFSTGTFTTVAEKLDFGLRYWRVITGTGVFGGIRFGVDPDTAAVDSIPVSASTTYRATAWLRGVSGYSGVNIAFQTHDQGNNFLGGLATVQLTADWVQHTFTFSTGVGDTFIRYQAIKNNDATAVTFDIAGLMLTLGTAASTVYNTGATTDRYEDVTEDVISASWNMGMDKKRLIPTEGDLTLALNNTTRRYSPRYTGSPLFGVLEHGIRVQIEVARSNGVYVVMWTGFIAGYAVHPGGTLGDLQTVITAQQGVFKLDEVTLQDTLKENVTFPTVLESVLTSGWYPASVSHVAVLDKSLLDVDTWLVEFDEVYNADSGLTTFPLVGDGWSDSNTRPSKVLEQLMEVEQGWLFLQRDGKFWFRNRDHYIFNTAADLTLSLDTQANRARYVYSPLEINAVNITYYPSGVLDDQIVWTSRRAVPAKAKRRFKIRPKFQYEEGAKTTVKSLNAFGIAGNSSTVTAVDAGGNVVSTSLFQAESELKNGKAIVTLYNNAPFQIFFSLQLKGTIEVNVNTEELEIVGENISRDKRVETINNRLVKDDTMATNLANYIITLKGQAFDEFTGVQIHARDATWTDRMIDTTPGELLSLTEFQTGVTSKKHLIIGEDCTWTPGHLVIEYQLSRIDETEYWILNTSELNQSTYLGY